jgi:hypothetical protein
MNTDKCEQALKQEILATTKQIRALVTTKTMPKATIQLDQVVVPHLAHLSSMLKQVEYIKHKQQQKDKDK